MQFVKGAKTVHERWVTTPPGRIGDNYLQNIDEQFVEADQEQYTFFVLNCMLG